ncbi:MAG TPA: hypothetical protein VN256_20100 [Pyrinomonadaceae bacterium]|nr:hypothetical protein [Pyrinomonadaceae bacterium]
MTNKSINFKSTYKASEVAEYLGLKHTGKDSFISLCEKGCDAEELGNYFKLLTSRSEIVITRRYIGKRKRFATSREHAERMSEPQRTIDFRSMDSIEAALGEFQKRDLERLQKKLKKIAVDIQKLNNTNLVRRIDKHKYHPEVSNLPPLLNYYADKFIKLMLRETEGIGAKQKPDHTRFMKGLYKYVRDNTKEWHDALIADVLNEIGPDSKDTEQSLKEWRNRHGIIEKKVTRKNQNL